MQPVNFSVAAKIGKLKELLNLHFEGQPVFVSIDRITKYGNYREITPVGMRAIAQSFAEKGLLENEPLLLRMLPPEEAVLKDGLFEYECVDGNHRLMVLRQGWDAESKGAEDRLTRQWLARISKVRKLVLHFFLTTLILSFRISSVTTETFSVPLPAASTTFTILLQFTPLHGKSFSRCVTF